LKNGLITLTFTRIDRSLKHKKSLYNYICEVKIASDTLTPKLFLRFDLTINNCFQTWKNFACILLRPKNLCQDIGGSSNKIGKHHQKIFLALAFISIATVFIFATKWAFYQELHFEPAKTSSCAIIQIILFHLDKFRGKMSTINWLYLTQLQINCFQTTDTCESNLVCFVSPLCCFLQIRLWRLGDEDKRT